MTVSTKLESMDRRIEEKSKEIAATPREGQARTREELKSLQQEKEKLLKRKQVLDAKMKEGAVLSPQEQRRFLELTFLARHYQ